MKIITKILKYGYRKIFNISIFFLYPKLFLSYLIFFFTFIKCTYFLKKTDSDNSKKKNILYIDYKFYHYDKKELNPNLVHTIPWLKKLNYNVDTFFYDEVKYELTLASMFFLKVIKSNPSLIIMSTLRVNNKFHPSHKLLKYLIKKINCKFIFMWWDSCSKSFTIEHKNLIDHNYFNLHICADNPRGYMDYYDLSKKNKDTFYFDFVPPPDIEQYKSNPEKNYDVVFMGQGHSYRDYRMEFIDYLEKNLSPSFNVYLSINQRGNQPSNKMHSQILSKAKIGLNFSMSVDYDQIKGRSLYTMISGALLIETENKQVSKLFDPYNDYVPFKTKEELLEKIIFYLKNDKERERIALNGMNKCLNNFDGISQWKVILEKIKLK